MASRADIGRVIVKISAINLARSDLHKPSGNEPIDIVIYFHVKSRIPMIISGWGFGLYQTGRFGFRIFLLVSAARYLRLRRPDPRHWICGLCRC